MSEDAIGRQALVHLAEMRALGRRLPRSRDSRLGVDHDVAGHEACGHQRRERQDGGRRVAAGTGDEPRAWQAALRFAPSCRRLCPSAAPSRRDTSGRGGRRRAAGRRRRDRRRVRPSRGAPARYPPTHPQASARNTASRRAQPVHVERLDRAVPDARQPGQRSRRRLLRGHRGGQRHFRMARQQAHQLLPGVARGAPDPDRNSCLAPHRLCLYAAERITIRQWRDQIKNFRRILWGSACATYSSSCILIRPTA